MDATQMISDSILESDEEENEEENENKRGRPMAKLCVLKNKHIPETELPLFLGDNVLGRDPNTCNVPLPSPSISKQHATISISVYRRRGCHSEVDIEALVWDLGSMNGTRKGRLKLTPNVRYALSECDSLVVGDIPCQYVSCAAQTETSQEDLKTHVSITSGVKAKLPAASGEKGSDSSAGSEKCVYGSTEARVSLPDLEDTRKTPVRTSCLSFEQTPTQPQGTLVPESDSDSDGDRERRADRRRKAVVSDSDSYKSSPTCSTFLSPTNKIVPESEDESPITPSVSTNSMPHRHVSFSKEETDRDVGRMQLKEKKAPVIVDDSEGEEGGEEERAALGGRKSTGSGQDLLVTQGIHVSRTEENKLPVSTTAFTDVIPAFNMHSDTDIEGEEKGVTPALPVTLYTNQQADQPSNTAEFHIDSDTDIDEDDDALDKVPKSVPSLAETSSNIKPSHLISVIKPEAIAMDSDTDVDEDEEIEHGAIHTCSKKDETPTRLDIKPMGPEPTPDAPHHLHLDSDTDDEVIPAPCQSTHTADSSPPMQSKDCHLDSDTDVDEEVEKFVTISACSKKDETPIRFDIKPIGPESAPAAPHSLHPDSDTADEAIPAPDMSEPPVMSAVTESCTTADKGADLDILSDSDTDVKDDSPLGIPFATTTLSLAPGTAPEAHQSDSDADTDVDESSMPPVDRVSVADLHVDSDTDVAVKEVDFGRAHEGQIPTLCRENTPGFLIPLLQNCSTPVQLSEEEGDMDKQVSSSSDQFTGVVAPVLRPKASSLSSDNLEDEDLIVAETQSFVQTRDRQGDPLVDHTMDSTQAFCLETSSDEKDEQSIRGGSFQLGVSDSSHLQVQAQALAMESTQTIVCVQDSLPYADISKADRTFSENDSNLEATQVYGENEEHARCSVTSGREGQVDLALEATQTYISEPYCDSEDEMDEDERTNIATAETQLLDFATSSTLAFVETQPMSAFEEGESLDEENPVSSVQQVKSRSQNKTEDTEERGEAIQLQERPLSEALAVAETQPMCVSDDEERDVENFIPDPQKREEKPLLLEDEQTKPLTSSELSLVETQPMTVSGYEDSDKEDTTPGPRGSKAKQHWAKEEVTQTLTNSALSAVETQSVDMGKPGESDKEDSIRSPLERKAKPLQLEEDETQTLTNYTLSAVETQLMDTSEHGESDEEDSIPGPRKRKAKQLHFEDEQTQSLISSEVSSVETQPMVMGEDRKSDDEDSIPRLRKRKAKLLQIQEEEKQPLTNCEATIETLPLETKTCLQPQTGNRGPSEAGTSGITTRGKRGAGAQLREKKEQANCSEPPKRQTKMKIKALPMSQLRSDESEEVEEIVQTKRARGKKSMKQQKDDEEDKESERHKHAENVSLMNEQEGRLREDEEESQCQREEKERLERERKEKEEQERIQLENAELLRLELERATKETIERERKEQEEKERADRTQKDKENLEGERKKNEEKVRLQCDKAERDEPERSERREQKEEVRLETPKRELVRKLEMDRNEQEHQRLEIEAKEMRERERFMKEKQEREAKEKPIEDQQEKMEEENKFCKAPARGRRAARRTTAALRTTELEKDSTLATNDDVPARRTRSRSNSSNSVNSERSAANVNSQESRGRGRGRGAKTTSEPSQTATARRSNRRRTVATEPTEQSRNYVSPQALLLRSNSNNSLSSDISSCSLGSQTRGRGRGGRYHERGRKTEAYSIPSTARGRMSRKTEESSSKDPHTNSEGKADSQQANTTRGRWRASVNDAEPEDEENSLNQEKGCAGEESLPPKRNVRGRGQKAGKSETVEAPATAAVSDGDEAEEKSKGRKRELEANAEEGATSSSKISKWQEKAQTTDAAEEDAKGETKDVIPVQVQRKGRTSRTQVRKNSKDSHTEVQVKVENVTMEEVAAEKRGRGRPSAIEKKKKVDQETPTSSVFRKRQAPADSSPAAKTPRSSSASPAASGRLRAASQTYKVLFTGVVDEAGEKVLAHFGGSMAKGVADMNCLVTDKVRRTVKFLCAVAKGVPIVTTNWLEKSGKAGSFLSPDAFIVKDPEQEKKFSFCLQESLKIASNQPLLQGYEIHVTKSVKPEPPQMKDILTCSGATFLSKMPSSNKPQTVVISCEEDLQLCGPALSASLPIVTAEFILTGILQQKLDFQSYALSAPTSKPQPAGGRGRGRKRT